MPDTWDVEQFTACWRGLYARGVGAIFGAFRPTGELSGVCGLYIAPSLNSGRVQAVEAFWYAQKHAKAGPRLLRAAEDWAWRQGAEFCLMVALASSKDAVGLMLQRKGYRIMEARYVKERPEAASPAGPPEADDDQESEHVPAPDGP
jgi:hypothetical protein